MPDPAFMEIIREQMLAADRDRQSQALQPRRHFRPDPSGWNQTQRQWEEPIDPGPHEIPEQDPWPIAEREGEIKGWTRNPGYLPQGGTTWGQSPPVNLPGEVVPSQWGATTGDAEWGDSSSFMEYADGTRSYPQNIPPQTLANVTDHS
jgi:hypothetical protein